MTWRIDRHEKSLVATNYIVVYDQEKGYCATQVEMK
jgi:hypothetical protein